MAIVICHTEGCSKAEVPVEAVVSWDDHGVTRYVDSVTCGACGQPIVTIDPPLPDPTPEESGGPDLLSLQQRCDSLQEQVDLLILTTLG